jgi:RNA polymerase sigma factor (sigma-70 family)
MMRNNEEVVMKRKYNNLGIEMSSLSMTDPERYRKIHAVLSNSGVKEDLLDKVETIPLEYVYDLADKGPSPEDAAFETEMKNAASGVLSSLTPREERIIRRRFGMGVPDATLEEIGIDFSVTKERIRGIEGRALRKLKHPSRSKKIIPFISEIAA